MSHHHTHMSNQVRRESAVVKVSVLFLFQENTYVTSSYTYVTSSATRECCSQGLCRERERERERKREREREKEREREL